MRKRLIARLSVQSLEERATPATAIYSAPTQTLTLIADEGDQISIASLGGQPAGYVQVTESQLGDTVFDSMSAGQSVRNLIVKFGNVNSGGFVLDANAQIGGSLTIYGAKSSQTVSIAGTVGANVIYSASASAAFDVVDFEATSMIGRNLTLGLKDGTNTVRFKSGMINGNVLVRGGAGEDTIEVTEAGDVTINGSATFLLGNGSNNFIGKGPVNVASLVYVGSAFTYGGGIGNDKFDLDHSGTSLNVGTDARFTFGTPSQFDGNLALFEAVRAGRNVVFNGGIGNDTVIVSGALEAKGNVAMNLGAGDNMFDSNKEGIATNSIAGSFSYIGGADGDQVNLDAMTIGKNLTVALGENNGSSQGLSVGLKSPVGVTIFGAAKVTGGSGAEGVVFRRAYIGGALNVSTGAASDTVAFDDLKVAGASWIDLGAGDDLLQSELLPSDGAGTLTSATSFGGKLTLRAGDGNDTVDFSDDNEASTYIQFGGRVVLQGGGGNDMLKNASENIFSVLGNISDFDEAVGAAFV